MWLTCKVLGYGNIQGASKKTEPIITSTKIYGFCFFLVTLYIYYSETPLPTNAKSLNKSLGLLAKLMNTTFSKAAQTEILGVEIFKKRQNYY